MQNFRRLQKSTRKRHPIPKLLYLEWILLAVLLVLSIGDTILPSHWFLDSIGKEFSVLFIVIFGVMGIYLPINNSLREKILFTVLECFLIGIVLYFGGLRGLVLPYIVLVLRSCILFQTKGRISVIIIVGIFSFFSWWSLYTRISNMPQENLRSVISSFGILFFVIFFLNLFFILVMMETLSNESKGRENLREANEKLKQYSSLLKEHSKIRERNRIARDIHDSLGHSLTGINLQLEAAGKLFNIDPETSHRLMIEAKGLAVSCLQDIRHVIRELRVELSLDRELKKLASEVQKWSQIRVGLDIEISRPLPITIQSNALNIIREAVNNSVKHAHSTEINIKLWTSSTLSLEIKDNGCGFHVDEEYPGVGLKSIRERSASFGGTCEIMSTPNGGTIIKVVIPIIKDKT